MAKRCGMSQGLYNPFFQNGAPWFGMGGVSSSDLTLITDAPESEVLRTDDGEELTMDE